MASVSVWRSLPLVCHLVLLVSRSRKANKKSVKQNKKKVERINLKRHHKNRMHVWGLTQRRWKGEKGGRGRETWGYMNASLVLLTVNFIMDSQLFYHFHCLSLHRLHQNSGLFFYSLLICYKRKTDAPKTELLLVLWWWWWWWWNLLDDTASSCK